MPVDAPACFGSGNYMVCLSTSQLPTQTVTLPNAINTDDTSGTSPCLATPSMTWTGQPDACFVVGTTIASPTGGGTTTVTGSRPLVLLATDSMTLNTVDVSSHAATGAAADFSGCLAFTTPEPANSASGGGGGAGGTFMKVGGVGAVGDNGLQVGGAIEPHPSSAPTALRGGCAGEFGGFGTGNPGTPGAGGGAIYLVAAHDISISGRIAANGAGATHGGHASGGSGGGSGGMIVVYAETITGTMAAASLSANGGGGSSGGDSTSNGMDGTDSISATTAAAGGSGPGGAGGPGSVSGVGGPGQAGGTNQGGGGGGGGAGYIQIHGTMTSLTISPPAATF